MENEMTDELDIEEGQEMDSYYKQFVKEASDKTDEAQLQKAFALSLEKNIVPLTKVKLNRENWNMLFPNGFVETPVGTVKLGENQFEKLQKSDRNDLLGAMYETLSNPSIVLEKETLDKNSGDFKPVNVYGKSFVHEDSNHKRVVESVIIFNDGEEISISTHNKEIGRFTRQIKTADQIIYADSEISRVASLILKNGGSHVQLEGINAQALNKGYNKNNVLSIKDLHFSNRDETLNLADEVDHISKENKEMENKPNEESNNILTPKEYLKNLLSKAEIEVVEDTGVMRAILEEGKRVQKMAAKYGTSQDIDGEETFNGFGTYVVSVNEENARQLGIKIASKRYGGSFYINGQPFNEFLKEKNFSPYWESRLEQFKDYNVAYLADDFLRADVKGNSALEKERDTLSTLFSLGLVEYKREQAFLYSVDIPDNDSTNYLLYGNPIGIENANRINERLERMNVEWRVTRNDIGKNIYFNTLSEKVFGGSQESASKFLKEAGYVGMEMNSANYIVFDDKDMKVTDRVQYMIDGESNVYGFAYDGKIYADPEIATSNTYAHEYTHLWDAYTQRTNPELWERGKEIFKGTSLWNEVMTDENYQSLSNDDEILSECHSRIVGRMAEKVLERIAERNGGILRDQVIDWDNEVAEYVASELGAEFPQPELGSENYISDSVRLEIAREFLSQPMKDLMEGRKITLNIPFQNTIQKMVEEHAFPDVREYFKFNKTDNENFRKALDKFDGFNPLQLIKVGEIPPVMKALGISDNPIEMPQSVVSKALREEAAYPGDKKGHALTMEHVKKIPESLADPIMVFKSRTRDDSYVFFTEQKDEADRSIIIPVAVDKRYGRLVINEITSIYGKDNEAHFVKTNIEQGNLVYADKKRSLDWERECQVQFLAQVLPSEGSYSSILTKENLVNFVSAIDNEKIQKLAESVENEKDPAASTSTQLSGATSAQGLLDAQDTATAISTHIHHKDNIVEIKNQELQEQVMEENIVTEKKTVKASEIFKDFEESMIFSGISQKDFDSAMLEYLHQRSGREEAEAESFDTQDLMFDFLVAQEIHDERAQAFALDKIKQYEGMTVEFDADNIDLGYLKLSDREGAKEIEKKLEELKVAHPILVKNLSVENPFLNADPKQVQELYEEAEAVEKMQQEAALTVEFDENGNPYYPKNEVTEESLQDKFRRENEMSFRELDAYLENGKAPKNSEFLFKSIPDVLKYAAIPEHEIVLTTGIIAKARKTHQLSDEAIRKAIISLADPVAVFDSDRNRTENKSASIIAITDVESSNGKPVALSLNLDAQRKGFEQQYIVNEIRSIHDRTLVAKNGVNITEEWANAGLLRYVDDKKISSLEKEREDSFLLPLAKLDMESVLTKSDFVKQFDDKKISDWQLAAGVQFPLAVLQSDNYTIPTKFDFVKQFDDKKISEWDKAAGVQSPLAVPQSDDNNILRKSDIVNNQDDIQEYSDEMDKGIEKNAKFFESIKKYLENGISPIYNEFKISETPQILQYAGVPNHEIVITTKILNKAKNAAHNLDNEEILSALKGLSNPIIIFDSDKEKSEAKGNSVLIFTEGTDKNNKPLAIGFEMETQKQGLENYIVNQIHSIHPRTTLINSKGENMLEKWTEKGLIKYLDDKKISGWLKDRQVQFPLSLASPDEITITNSEDTVKHFPVKTRTGFESQANLQEKSTDVEQQNDGSPVQPVTEQQTTNPDDKRQDTAQSVDKDILPAFALVTKDGLKMFEGYKVQGFDNETRKYTVENERGDSIKIDEATIESIRNPQNTITAEKEKNIEAVQTQSAIVAGKTRVPEFAMITQNGLKEFKDMVVQKYSPSEKMWTLSNAEGEKVSISENTFKELTSESQRSRARDFDENTPAYKKMLETQYNDYFKQRENTASNFIHNLSVYSRKEANSPIDAIRLSSVIIKQMSPGEKQKTKELLKTLCKDGETINGLIANTYLEAVKDKPLNEEYILSGRYKDTIARPMYDTISAKGEKVDNNFNLRVGDTISNVSFKAKKTFGVGSEKMVADWTVISASKQGNLITLKSGNSFRDVPRDTFLKQYSKQEKNEQKQQVKERKRNTLNMDIER